MITRPQTSPESTRGIDRPTGCEAACDTTIISWVHNTWEFIPRSANKLKFFFLFERRGRPSFWRNSCRNIPGSGPLEELTVTSYVVDESFFKEILVLGLQLIQTEQGNQSVRKSAPNIHRLQRSLKLRYTNEIAVVINSAYWFSFMRIFRGCDFSIHPTLLPRHFGAWFIYTHFTSDKK